MRQLILCALLCFLGAKSAWAVPALDAFGKLPAMEGAQMSPDGGHFAMIVTDGDQRSVDIFSTADRKLVKVVDAGQTKVRSLQWAGNDNLVVTISKDIHVAELEGDKQEWFVAVDISLGARKSQGLLEHIKADEDKGETDLNAILATPMVRAVNGKIHVFVEGFHFTAHTGTASLYDFDPASGIARLIAIGQHNTSGWLVDAAGKILAQTQYDGDAGLWTLKVRRGDDLKVAKTVEDKIDHPDVVGLGRDGASVLLAVGAGPKGESRHDALVEVPVDGKDWSPPIFDRDFDEAIFDSQSHALIGVRALVGDNDSYTFFDSHDQTIWEAIVKAYPGARVSLASMSADHTKLIVVVDSATEGESYNLVDIDKRSSDWLGTNYGDASASIAAKSAISFKAADGLPLTGYLTLPAGRPAKALPLIVFPHGGPAARDEPGFDWWAQAMASRGYAVLQVNYRGSNGFGWEFMKAGFGQFGRKMQTDLSDGVRYLAAQGTIDPKRACIVGASYGGYAALAGASIDTGVYRCAVSVAGISDLKRDIGWSADDEHGGASSARYWLRFMGVDRIGDPRLEEISPIRHVDKVDIPILLIHGKDDTVVDFSQSQVMYDALKKAGKDVELVVLPHENHHLLTGATRLRMLEATMDFLAKNNPAN